VVYQILKALALPPISLILLVLLGLGLRRHPRLGRACILTGALGLLLLSLPIVPRLLMTGLEPYPALDPAAVAHSPAQAIVVLGAERYTWAPEYAGDSIGALTLQRLRYAAWLQRRSGLPLYVSGGSPPDEDPPLGRLMREVLEQEFGVPVTAVEEQSRTTAENARLSARLRADRGIGRIYLVSHAWHLPRAVAAFERAGLRVIPAPTAFVHRNGSPRWDDFLPSAGALLRGWYAMHEYVGQLWYRLRRG
jgi:uncharacterized SAM-binding protein YcdF (DUF218 family)